MNRVVFVTGGSRGIGAAISIALKNAGYKVAANYAGNDEAAQKFTAETGIKTYKWSVADYVEQLNATEEMQQLGINSLSILSSKQNKPKINQRLSPSCKYASHDKRVVNSNK